MIDYSAAIRENRNILSETTSTREAIECVSRIKDLTREQLREIDPDIYVENTSYFNHSAIPDFVIKWSGRSETRDLFLRPSYAEILAAEDVSRAGNSASIFVALDSRQDILDDAEYSLEVNSDTISIEASRSERTLVSDIEAVAALSASAQASAGPMAELVKQNFVSGARGWVSEARASQLVASVADDSSSLGEMLEENFVESAVLRMRRTAAIIDLVTGRGDLESEDARASLIAGRLSETEVRVLVPWLVDNAGPEVSDALWRRLGGLFSLEDLEKAYELLADKDLTLLVAANAGQWNARRSYLGLAISSDDGQALTTGGWRFRGKILGLEIGDMRLGVASSGRKLPSRDGISASPSWDDVVESLADFRLSSVSLRGITRSIRVDAETSDDVRQDVVDIASSLADSYSVAGVSVRLPSHSVDSLPTNADVVYSTSNVTSDSAASLADLTRLSLRALPYRNPVDSNVLDFYTGSDSVL